MKRNEDELVKRVFDAMNASPLKGDWSNLVYEDMTKINLGLSDEEISQFTRIDFKAIVKTKMRKYVLDELKCIIITKKKFVTKKF